MGRKCSHCGKIGHNSRTCSTLRGNINSSSCSSSNNNTACRVKLFGVQLEMPSATPSPSTLSIKKSFSLDCLASSSSTPSSSTSSRVSADENSDKFSHGYLSDGLIARPQERKKGVPWSEEEHRTFLLGLERLGRGDWRGISRNFVTTRTPTQVASHAQKYFLRQSNFNKKRRRPSLFDLVENRQFSFHLVNPSISQPNQSSIPYGFSLKTTNSTLIDLNS